MLFSLFQLQAIAFFGGYSLFSAPLTLLNLTCHIVGGALISLLILTKAHYAWIWYIFAVFSCIPTFFDVSKILSACLRSGERS